MGRNAKLIPILIALLVAMGCGAGDTSLTQDEEKAFRGSPPPADYMEKAKTAPNPGPTTP